MTITSTANKIIFLGNGVTTSFPFTFPGIAAADILAYYTDTLGNITTLTQGSGTTQYQVSLTAAVPPNPTGIGGTVTYNPSGTPIATGTSLTIIRTMPLTQGTSLAAQGTLYPSIIEQALDGLLAQIQQINELLGRAISVAVSDSTPSNLPPAAQRSGKFLSFDSSGNPIAATTVTGTAVSSAMAPVISAATLAAGRTAFGLGNIAVENMGAGLQDDGSSNVRVNLEVTTSDSTNQTVTSAFHNTQRAAIGPITYTLPRANTLWNGFGFRIENGQTGGDVTLAINVNDNFQNYTSGTSLIIGRGASIQIWTDAAASGVWYYRLSGGKKLVGDAAYTLTPADLNVLTSAALTTSRTWTLAGASTVKAGTLVVISDQANAITSTNTLVVSRAGADTIVAQGTTVNTFTMFTAGANATLISDGVSKWNLISRREGVNVQRFTSGVAQTYTAIVGSTRQRVRMWAGGGGGGARATNNGLPGNDTTFQVNGSGTAWQAVHGNGGPNGGASTVGSAGGTGGTTGTGTLIYRANGGQGGSSTSGAGATFAAVGGTVFSVGILAPTASNATDSIAAAANSGAGGNGGYASAGASGGGGGGGEYVEFWVTGMTTAIYTVGPGGAGGAAGTTAGGAGGSGMIIIEEYFD